jgi:hypothetical protein
MAQYTLPTTKKYQKPVKETEATEPKKSATLDDLLAQQPEGGYFGQAMRDLADVGRAAQRGIVKGGISVPAISGELERLTRMGLRGIGYDVSPDPYLYGMEEYQSLIPSLATEAETATGRVVETGLEYGVGAGIPMGLPAKTAKAVTTVGGNVMDFLSRGGLLGASRAPRAVTPAATTAPTVASEALKTGKLFSGIGTAAGLAGEAGGQMAETGAGLGLTGGAILASMLRRSPAGMLKGVTERLSPEDIERARLLQDTSQRLGVPLSSFETLDQQQLRDVADFVAQQPEGQGLLDFLATRELDIKPTIKAQIKNIEKTSRTKPQVAIAAQKAANKSIKDARGNVTGATTALYEAAKTESIEPQLVSDIVKNLRDMKAIAGKDTVDEINNIIGRLTGKGGRVVTNVNKLRSELRRLTTLQEGAGVLSQDARMKEIIGEIGEPISDLRDALNTNPNIMAANAIFQDGLVQFEDALGLSGIQALDKAGIKPKSVYRVITDIEQVDPENIRAISKALNAQDPTIFPDIINMWMSNSVNKATAITAAGKEPTSAGVKFAQLIRGSDDARANLDAILEGVADAQGVDATQLKTGFNDMLDVLERTNLLPAVGSRTFQRGDIKEAIEGRGLLFGLDVTKPLGTLEKSMQERRRISTVRRLSDMFTDEDSISKLLELAAEKDMARKRAIVGGIFTTVRETTEPDSGLLADQ